MANDRVKLIFDLLTGKKDVNKDLDTAKKKTDQVTKSAGQLKDSFISVKGAVLGLGATIAALGVRKMVQFAIEQEDAVTKLSVAMKQSGEFSKIALTNFKDFADTLQATSRISNETGLEMLSLAKSFGATNDEAIKIVQAAVDMSAALGIDVRSAIVNLSKTTSGLLGEMGEVVKETRTLTKEQLMAGDAIDLVARKFKGFAEKESQTFSGQLNQINQNWNDLLKAFGQLIIETPQIIQSVGAIASGIKLLTDTVIKIKKPIQDGLITTWNNFKSLFTGRAVTSEIVKPLNTIDDAIARIVGTLNDVKTGAKAASSAMKALPGGGKMLAGDVTTQGRRGGRNRPNVTADYEGMAENVRDSVGGSLFNLTTPEGIASTVAKGLLKGFGPLGDLAAQFIKIFSMGPEQFQQMIDNIAKNLPKILTNIFRNLFAVLGPEFVNTFITNLINELPLMVEAFVAVVVQQFTNPVFWLQIAASAAGAFVKSIPLIVQGFIDGIRRGLAHAASTFIEEIIHGARDFVKELLSFGGGGGPISGLTSNIPVIGGAVSSVLGGIGLNKGGRVPGTGNKDTVPAVLTPGERVLTREQNKLFENAMVGMARGGGGNSGSVNVTIQVGQRELARVLLDLNRQNLRTA